MEKQVDLELSYMNQEELLYQRESYDCFVSLDSFFFFKIYLFIIWLWVISARGLSLVLVRGLLIAMTLPVGEHRL